MYSGNTLQGLTGQILPKNFLPHRRQVLSGIPGRPPSRLLPRSPSACSQIPPLFPPRTAFPMRQGQVHSVPPSSPTGMALLRRAQAACPPRQRHIPDGACRFPLPVSGQSLWSLPLPTGAFFHSTVPSLHRP